jgi:transcriptional regulator with XRE-family HTH domain
MVSDHGPVVQSALLRSELVRLRRERGLTQAQVAADLAWMSTKLIRAEGGHSLISEADLDALLQRYGVTSNSQRERLRDLNRGAHATGWWEAYRGDVAAAYLDYVGHEAGAASIRQYLGAVVPGLLQTREYAAAISAVAVEPERADPVIRLRLQRQSELAQRQPAPRQCYVVDEAVIRRRIGFDRDRAIMRNQLLHIVGMARTWERISVQVIPFDAGEHPGLTGPFTLLDFDAGLPGLLYIDTGQGFLEMISGAEGPVAEFADNFERLTRVALSADQSLEFIQSAAEQMT